jgi:phosphatidyl-myo-inositol dimannoside synthase
MSRIRRNAIMLAYDFYPSEGGIQTFMHSLVAADIGIDWTVLTRKANPHSTVDLSYNIVRTAIRPQLRITDKLWLKMHRSQFSLQELIAFQTKRKLVRVGRQTKADFLLADQLCSAFSVRAAARKLGVPWGLVVHGKEILEEKSDTRNLLADANLIIANSTFTKGLAKERGAKEEQIRILHPSVNTNFFVPPTNRDIIRKQLSVDGRDTLVTVAHLIQRKGHEQVIQALPAVKSIFPNVIYLIVGRGAHENSLHKLAEDLGVSDSVRFCGYVLTQDLPQYYGAADIHIMASTCDGDVEGFGISFIEAAACGTPSIGSRSGGILDAISGGKTGVLVEPGDVENLATTILEILNNVNLRKKMGVSARKMVEKHFSRIAFEQVLRDVLNHFFL